MKIRNLNFVMMMFFVLTICFMTSALASRKADNRDYNGLWRQYLQTDASKSLKYSYPYEACFKKSAKEFDLPFSLLLALVRGESNFNPKAQSGKSCYGLMQIQWPGTAHHLDIDKKEDLLDPCISIRGGARYLRELLNRYDNNLHLSLAAYNYGPGRISRGASPDTLPDGAVWYSSYIFHHLEHIMEGTTISVPRQRIEYNPGKKLRIITFNKPYRAEGFMNHIKQKAPELELEWFKMGLGLFQVVLMYEDDTDLQKGIKRLKSLGFRVKNNGA